MLNFRHLSVRTISHIFCICVFVLQVRISARHQQVKLKNYAHVNSKLCLKRLKLCASTVQMQQTAVYRSGTSAPSPEICRRGTTSEDL